MFNGIFDNLKDTSNILSSSNIRYVVVEFTSDDQDVVNDIVSNLLEARFVVCADVSSVGSSYIWKGSISNNKEYKVCLKTKTTLLKNVIQQIRALHNYEIPGIIVLPMIGGDPEYFNWIDSIL